MRDTTSILDIYSTIRNLEIGEENARLFKKIFISIKNYLLSGMLYRGKAVERNYFNINFPFSRLRSSDEVAHVNTALLLFWKKWRTPSLINDKKIFILICYLLCVMFVYCTGPRFIKLYFYSFISYESF